MTTCEKGSMQKHCLKREQREISIKKEQHDYSKSYKPQCSGVTGDVRQALNATRCVRVTPGGCVRISKHDAFFPWRQQTVRSHTT